LRADVNSSRYTLRQARQRRAAIEKAVETRIRIAMDQAGSSFSAIELTAAAAAAAGENLRIVTDAYSKGAVSVTDLIDAQNAALGAELAAAEAKYVYLSDILEVLRATGDFSLMLDPGYVEVWHRDVRAWLGERGLAPAQQAR